MDSQGFSNVLQCLRKLEDESALDSLLNRYCWQVGLMNWKEFGKTYVQDARMDFEAFGGIRGRQNIFNAIIQAGERFDGMQHSTTNREFTINYSDDSLNGRIGDRATATAYLIFTIIEDSANLRTNTSRWVDLMISSLTGFTILRRMKAMHGMQGDGEFPR
ncbi:hypothetical protein FDENT_13125 [Fusarium denticulatum]|uniref:SnoaL-like domain-containing protein n=1 Tax=Fusarium denticulatum TaxID=48507 RepID=A0A8H5T5I5_9HYPO|nr:hypothetical protein FDENT_13125 [Fusarium denticulatum]